MMTATCCGRRFKSILSNEAASSAFSGFNSSVAFTRVRSKDRQPEKLTHAGVTRKARNLQERAGFRSACWSGVGGAIRKARHISLRWRVYYRCPIEAPDRRGEVLQCGL